MKVNEENIRHIYETISSIFFTNLIFTYKDNKSTIRLSNIELPECIKQSELNMINEVFDLKSLRKSSSICYYKMDNELKYMILSVFQENKYEGNIVVGPYINNPLKLDMEYKSKKELYKLVPIIKIPQEKSLENIIVAMINSDIKNIQVIDIKKSIDESITNDKGYIVNDFDMSILNIRERYKIEEKLLHYVSTGNKEKALEYLNKIRFIEFNRFPEEPIRNIKNSAITMNTLLRKSVQQSNIEPLFIDSISDYFAKKIERSNNINYLGKIHLVMIKEYCDLVNEYKVKGYSNLISNAVNYIKLNFEYDISLSSIAKELYIHPTHLSKKFRKETNKTISEYINEIRIEEAKLLLKTTDYKVEDIAYAVGYNDKKYFSKVFKKISNQSPSEYRNYN